MLRNAIRFASAESFQYRFAICDGINLMPSKMIRYTLPPKWIERVFDTLWRVKATSLCVIKLVSRSYELGGTKDGSKVRFDNVGHWLGVCFVSWILSRRIRVFEFLITILQSFLIFVLDEFPWTAVSLRKSKLFVRFRNLSSPLHFCERSVFHEYRNSVYRTVASRAWETQLNHTA